jgi:hypothetical protein
MYLERKKSCIPGLARLTFATPLILAVPYGMHLRLDMGVAAVAKASVVFNVHDTLFEI